jgi:hypothetical protein
MFALLKLGCQLHTRFLMLALSPRHSRLDAAFQAAPGTHVACIRFPTKRGQGLACDLGLVAKLRLRDGNGEAPASRYSGQEPRGVRCEAAAPQREKGDSDAED